MLYHGHGCAAVSPASYVLLAHISHQGIHKIYHHHQQQQQQKIVKKVLVPPEITMPQPS